MKLRKLNGNDIFKMSRILKKIDLKIEATKEDGTPKSQIEVGLDMIKGSLENLHLAQDEVNDFLGNLCGCTGEEFGEKDLDEIFEITLEFKAMVNKSNFFTRVSQLMKSM